MSFLQRQILNSEINFPVCLAPMVGLSHVAIRKEVARYMPKGAKTIWPTEMLNSRRLHSENIEKTPETMRAPEETHLVPQILANEEVHIRKSMRVLEDWGAQGVDINMGCPVKKALKHNYGVALMGDINYAAEVVRVTKSATELPVSVKLRAGHQDDLGFLGEFVDAMQESGASWLCLHPRIASEKRKGRARWGQVGFVRDRLSIPVIGNGDVQCSQDVHDYNQLTNCDMVMVGRALMARPWLLWQIGEDLGFEAPIDFLEGQNAPRTSFDEGKEFHQFAKRVLYSTFEIYNPSLAIRKYRYFIKTASPWLSFGNHLTNLMMRSDQAEGLAKLLDDFFSKPQAMLAKTDLRI
ncbi:MAG: tRNA-dihydrouridine synthase family protein [Bdellovibrionales bacterium]